jgi:D-xylono/L-arabinono-1,4-lactonase
MDDERKEDPMSDPMDRLADIPVDLCVNLPCETGEGPLWHDTTNTLLWVDIPAGRVYRFNPEDGRNDVVYQHHGAIGGYTIQDDDSLVLFAAEGAILHLDQRRVEEVIPKIEAVAGSRFNDVIADPEGRVFCGTMPLEGDKPAHLYRLDTDGSLHLVFDDLTLSNGMGFSPDLSTFYLTDSESRRIFRMPYDRATGELGEREVLVQVPEGEGVPDGMAVDTEGTIWSARWGGSAIFRYSPDGELMETFPMPVHKVTSVTFAGDGYDEAYATSGGGQDRGEENGELAGSLFRVHIDARGSAPFRSRIAIP